jgi:serine acetyltransferase
LPGIKIGENCLIGAASLVSKNIPDCALAFGHPIEIKGDVSTILTENKPHYPWMYRYDRNMPWEGMNFDEWVKGEK